MSYKLVIDRFQKGCGTYLGVRELSNKRTNKPCRNKWSVLKTKPTNHSQKKKQWHQKNDLFTLFGIEIFNFTFSVIFRKPMNLEIEFKHSLGSV